MKLILLCVFGFFFLWFLLPVPLYGVFNVGTVTGLLGFGLCIALTLYWTSFAGVLSRIWAAFPGKLLLIVAAAAVLAAIVTAGVLGGKMIKATANPPQGDETVVVLGCRVRGDGPSKSLARRIDAAKAYLEANPDARCILSGGKGSDEKISEAQCMFDVLTDAGIDADRLFMEDRSTSTEENIRFSAEIIEAEGLSKQIALITDGYHQYRASLIAKEYVESVTAVPARTPVLLLPTYVVRELIGILYQTVFGS